MARFKVYHGFLLAAAFVVVVSMAAPALRGCGRNPGIARLNPDSVIVAFGDSLTFGSGVDAKRSYPAVLEQRVGCKVVNAGNPGELSGEGVARLPSVIERHHPSLLVLCHGGNDFLRKSTDKDVEANIRKMVELARENGADVVLLGVPRPGLFLSACPFYKEIARDCNIPYEGDALPKILSKGSLKNDYVHPNETGYRMLAEAVAELIRKSGGT